MVNQEYDRRLAEGFKASTFVTPQTKKTGDYWGPCTCPVCGKKNKAYTFAESPRKLMCNSASCEAYKDNGGVSMAEILDITFDIEKEYPSSPKEPNRTSDAYLQSRGLKKTLKNSGTMHWKDIRGSGQGGVMFDAGKNIAGKQVFTGRLYKTPTSGGKSHHSASVTGCIVKHPGIKHDYAKPVHLVEGPIDSYSLEEMGAQAISVISTSQDPVKLQHHLKEYKKIILCFDWDDSGIRCTKKFLKVFPDAEVMFMEKGKDWNDLLCSGPIAQATAKLKGNRQQYLDNGRLALASNPHEYGRLYWELFKKSGLYIFAGSTWFSEIMTRGKDEPTPKMERCGLFTIEVLCFIDVGGAMNNKEYHYKLKIHPVGSRPIECIATYRDLSTARDFNAFLLRTCKCTFEGKTNAMTAILVEIAGAKAPVARKTEYLGLDHVSGWWVSNEWAVDQNGGHHQKDDNGLFKVNQSEMLMPAEQAMSKNIIAPSLNPTYSIQQIYKLITDAFPVVGPIGFAWFVGSIFVNEVKKSLGFSPFLSIFGSAGTGKTCFVEELQLLQGWDSEGRDLSNSSSDKGQSRELYGASGMFRAFLEVTEENEKKLFSFINILAAYNRGGGSIKAQKTNDNSVNESNLYCALLFCQNVEVWHNKQQKTRNVSLHFTEENLNEATKAAYEKLIAIPKEDKATVTVSILKKRKEFMGSFDEEYKTTLADLEFVPPGRVRNNYALILSWHRLFCKIFSIENEIFQSVEEMAIEKEYSSKELNTNAASTFFEQLQLVRSEQIKTYWVEINDPSKRNHGTIYFSMFRLYALLSPPDFSPPTVEKIQKALKLHPSYLGHGQNYDFPVSSDTFGVKNVARIKAWRLDARKFRETENTEIGNSVKTIEC